jgi:hypothetical protein
MTLTAAAKIVAGALVGLAILAVVSLLWMARRVRSKRGFGPKSGAALRSVFPILLGLGGWCLGVLVVLAAELAVPLDHELLTMLTAGVPIGLGVYLAWVRPSDPDVSRSGRVGLVGAIAGALMGGWLGFGSSTGFLALFTTIVGATVGANVFLIGRDIGLDRSSRRPRAMPLEGVPEPVGAGTAN